MLSLLVHIYRFAEVYTVMLVWIVVPLGFFASLLFFKHHYGMFMPTLEGGKLDHGADRSLPENSG